ncbi:MAG TPA: ADOP family duplicated permease [Terriglobales bacterium]|nr:ADOP family duplicated permease [Terriglobales bacterium]
MSEELAFHRACAGEPGKLAGSDSIWEACHDQRGVALIENTIQDLRLAARRLWASPGLSLTATFVLAIGIAAATAMFALVSAVLLRPLPGADPASPLVHLERVEAGQLLGDFSYPDALDFRAMSHSYASLAAFSPADWYWHLRSQSGEAQGEMVSGNYFSTLGVRAELGRLLDGNDESSAQNRVVVLSDQIWRGSFGADPAIVGKTVVLNQTPMSVVGVASAPFHGATLTWATDVWAPITAQPRLMPMNDNGSCLETRNCGWVTVFGRLAPGVTVAQAQAEARLVAARIGEAHPLLKSRQAAVVAGLGLWSDDRSATGRFLLLMMGGTLLLVAMTSASVGSLFLARMAARQREVATQLALGARRMRVARQFLLEAGIVAAAGTLAGLAAATPLARALLRLEPTAPENMVVSLDWRITTFAVGIAVLSTLVMAAAPAFLAARASLTPGMARSRKRHAAQRWLLATQLGVALLLLIAAGLAQRSVQLAAAGQVPRRSDQIVVATLDTGRIFLSRGDGKALLERIRQRAAALPGVTNAVLASCVPPSFCDRGSVFVAGTEPPPAEARAHDFLAANRPDINAVTLGYFTLFQIPLERGRDFDAGDGQGRPLVCVVNQALAERLWPHQEPLGRQIDWPAFDRGQKQKSYFTVVGVVANRRARLMEAPPEQMFVPSAQTALPAMRLALSGALPTDRLFQSLRAAVAGENAALPVLHLRSESEQVRLTLWQPIAIADLAGLCGGLAALLAAIGLFGTLAQLVAERRHELGIRLALGAAPSRLIHMVARDAASAIAAGLLLGAGAAGVALQGLRPWLFDVHIFDPLSWSAAAALLAAIAFTGSYLAAARAASIPAAEALRCE